jgi:hypothetical protein
MTNHTPLTVHQLAEIEARVNDAEDGWHVVVDEANPHRFEIHGDGPTHVAVFGGDWDDAFASYPVEANAAFAAHARTDVPALLAEVRRLRAGVASERPTEDHDGVYVDEQGFLYGEYQASPRTDEVYLLRLQWVDEMAVAKSELEQQGAVFQHLGWCL